MKLYSLLQNKRKITEKRKKFFIVPAIVVIVALIAGIIFGIVNGCPFNVNSDFSDGYAVTVSSTALNEDNIDEYSKQLTSIIEDLKDDEGVEYGLKVQKSSYQGLFGTSVPPSIYIKYFGVSGDKSEADALMKNEVNPKLQEALQSVFDVVAKNATYDNGKVTISYAIAVASVQDRADIESKVDSFCSENSLTASSFTWNEDYSELSFSVGSGISAKLDELKTATVLGKEFAGDAQEGVKITAVVTNAILWISITAIIAAITLLALYVAFRFEVSTAVAMFLSLLCDALFVLAFVTVFHIKLNILFFAAIALVLVFSAITKLTVFDRIRDIRKQPKFKKASRFDIANTALSETMVRNFNISVVMLGLSVLVMAIAVPTVRMFAIPVILGILSNVFTTVCLAPSIWTLFKGVEVVARVKKPKLSKAAKAEKQKQLKNEVNDAPQRRYVPVVEPVIETNTNEMDTNEAVSNESFNNASVNNVEFNEAELEVVEVNEIVPEIIELDEPEPTDVFENDLESSVETQSETTEAAIEAVDAETETNVETEVEVPDTTETETTEIAVEPSDNKDSE